MFISLRIKEVLDRLLRPGSYHAVVANPPYITPKDAALNAAYRERYATCHMKYSLAVPFLERIVSLGGRRWLHRSDHGQQFHEAGVRQEADRGVLPADRSDTRHRH